MPRIKSIPFSQVREFYDRNQPTGTWFEPGSMRFFKTRLPRVAYELDTGGVYFVTRETSPRGINAYTVRRQMPDGDIDTVGEFHAYPTPAAARAAIRSL